MKQTFKLKYIEPTLIAVVWEQQDLEVLTFREGLYELTVEYNSGFDDRLVITNAEEWLQQNHIQLMLCNMDARRHMIWKFNEVVLNSCDALIAFFTMVRHGLPLDKDIFPDGRVNMPMIIQHPQEFRSAFLKIMQKIETSDEFEIWYDDFEALHEIIDEGLTADEIVELTKIILFTFSSYCTCSYPDAEQMPDDTFADLVAEPWVQDFLWWPMYVNDHPRAIIGNTIFHARMSKGWTEQQLADAAGIKASNVRNIESGRYDAKIDVLFAIAVALGITIEFGIEKK